MQFAAQLAQRTGWRRAIAAFAFGFAGALGFPPTGIFPILCLSFPALIIILRGVPSIGAAFVTGWCFAFGYFLLGIYWIAAAMFVDIGTFWWAVPLAVAGLPAACAIYYGFASAIAWRIGLKGVAGVVQFALCWFLADYARGHLLTGFPWNLEGYVWINDLPMMQIVSVTGIYGLTLLTMLGACLPVCFITMKDQRKINFAYLGGVVIICGLLGWGEARLLLDPMTPTSTRIRVVQPNIDQAHKWDPATRDTHFRQLLDMTSAGGDRAPDAIVWPETASTFYLDEDEHHRRLIAESLPVESVVLTGVIRRSLGEDGRPHYANSLIAIDRTSRIVAGYDKFHLVPFGEYIPFRNLLSLRALTNLGVDFTPGLGLRTMVVDGIPPFSPLVCYEAIFPGEVANRFERPQLMINVTNDGWYGRTAGPYQHFASARTRAIEEGLPLVRSANTGISGVIDAYGRIVTHLGLDKTGFVDADLPHYLPPTIFVRYGEIPLWGLFAFCVIVYAGLRWRQR